MKHGFTVQNDSMWPQESANTPITSNLRGINCG